MKKFVMIIFLSIQLGHANENKLSWSRLNNLEIKMTEWSQKVGEKGMLQIGKMKQRPDEIEIIRAYFPYLLPEGFFSYKMDMSCYPEFNRLKKKSNQHNYQKWQNCLKVLYRQSIPPLLKKALIDLRPGA